MPAAGGRRQGARPDAGENERLLEFRSVAIRFGGIIALDDVSFTAGQGRIVGIIGPNGAGKTTLFNCLSGLYRPQSGDIILRGQSIRGVPPHRMGRLGLCRTFQNLALFDTMTVRDNVMVGAHCRTASGFLSNTLRLPRVRKEEAEVRQRAEEILEYLELGTLGSVPVTTLPFATRKRVELGRALMAEPELLLLDEPAGGLNHEAVQALAALIRDLRDIWNVTILLVEHHMELVMGVSDQVIVLNFGRKIADGTPAEVRRSADVAHAYLGETA